LGRNPKETPAIPVAIKTRIRIVLIASSPNEPDLVVEPFGLLVISKVPCFIVVTGFDLSQLLVMNASNVPDWVCPLEFVPVNVTL
jgi:hypothetical protein